jgi:hypothetical protein
MPQSSRANWDDGESWGAAGDIFAGIGALQALVRATVVSRTTAPTKVYTDGTINEQVASNATRKAPQPSAAHPTDNSMGWPSNRGFHGNPLDVTLDRGVTIDRYGDRGGTFASPKGTPFGERALPASYETTQPYEVYAVNKPIPGVKMGVAEPWFGQPGMGVQYELPMSVQDLIDKGFLSVVKP